MSAAQQRRTHDELPVVLELEGVTKDYGSDVKALRGVDLAIFEGELAAIVGPSGSGKSTLLTIIGSLERPTSGSVRIAGHDAKAPPTTIWPRYARAT